MKLFVAPLLFPIWNHAHATVTARKFSSHGHVALMIYLWLLIGAAREWVELYCDDWLHNVVSNISRRQQTDSHDNITPCIKMAFG